MHAAYHRMLQKRRPPPPQKNTFTTHLLWKILKTAENVTRENVSEVLLSPKTPSILLSVFTGDQPRHIRFVSQII